MSHEISEIFQNDVSHWSFERGIAWEWKLACWLARNQCRQTDAVLVSETFALPHLILIKSHKTFYSILKADPTRNQQQPQRQRLCIRAQGKVSCTELKHGTICSSAPCTSNHWRAFPNNLFSSAWVTYYLSCRIAGRHWMRSHLLIINLRCLQKGHSVVKNDWNIILETRSSEW